MKPAIAMLLARLAALGIKLADRYLHRAPPKEPELIRRETLYNRTRLDERGGIDRD